MGILDPSLFSHEAHLRLAWIHLRQGEVKNAIVNVTEQIQAFAIRNGAPGKYHETVTVAAVKAVDHFMRRSKEKTFQNFITEFPRLKTEFKSLMDSHYSYNLFTSDVARKEFQEPDLAPFD